MQKEALPPGISTNETGDGRGRTWKEVARDQEWCRKAAEFLWSSGLAWVGLR